MAYKKTGNPPYRPTKYNKEIIEKAAYYRDHWKEIDPENVIPTAESLGLYLHVSRETLYAWSREEDKQDFSDIFREIMAKQANSLIQNGVADIFNPTITKVILTKHGYREGIEQTGAGGKDLFPDEESKKKADSIIISFLDAENKRNSKKQ